MGASKFLKAAIAVAAILVTFFFTGWVLNWAPLSNMLVNSGFYSDLCNFGSVGSVGCHAQQVAIAKLWSAIMLSEFTILPCGILMDFTGPILFTIFAGLVHCGSTLGIIFMSKDSPLLVIPFFGCGTAAHASALLAMRTVFVFDSPIGRSRWILICCTVFDSSAICTMFYYNLWQANLISIDLVFKSLAVLGLVLFGILFVLYAVAKRRVIIESATIEEPLIDESQSFSGEKKSSVDEKKEVTLSEIIRNPSFYFIIFFAFVSIYRIRYFLGIANYTLKRLQDDGFYLEVLGYCFCLTALFTPIVDYILRALDNVWTRFHLVNGVITFYFFSWLIPILPVQLVTVSFFVFARLIFFVVLNDYITSEFSEKWFGLIMGLGFVAAAIPGSFTYLIVQEGLKKFNGNFWVFHLMCILMAIPTMIAITLMKRYDDRKKGKGRLMIQAQIEEELNNVIVRS